MNDNEEDRRVTVGDRINVWHGLEEMTLSQFLTKLVQRIEALEKEVLPIKKARTRARGNAGGTNGKDS